jgi:hypothetical protein
MFNALPEDLKKEIKKEYRLHRTLVTLFAVFFLQICFLIAIFPTWANSYFKEKGLATQIEDMNNSQSYQDADAVYSIIESTNLKLRVINVNLASPKVVPIVKQIISSRTSGISLSKLSFVATGGNTAVVSIEGVSKTRESLISYVSVLEKSKIFKTVDLPISNLADEKNIDFTINLTVEQ